MNGYVNIGLISTPHGVKGWVKVVSQTDVPERFSSIERVFLTDPKTGEKKQFELEDVKYQPDRVLLKIKGIDTREQADLLRGKILQVPESEVPDIEEEDTYYIYQLEGMTVFDENGVIVGTLETVYGNPANDIYGIRSEANGKELLIPAIRQCVLEVNVREKKMIIDRAYIS